MQQVPHCPRCGRNNHVYLYKNYDDDNLDHRLAAAENRDNSLDRLEDRLRARAADYRLRRVAADHRLRDRAAARFPLAVVLLLLLGVFFLGGFLRSAAGVGLVVIGFVLVRHRTADPIDHGPVAVHGARAGGPPGGLRATTSNYVTAATALRRRTAFRTDADDACDAGCTGRLAALLHRGANGYIGERTKFCYFIPTDSSKTYICDYKH